MNEQFLLRISLVLSLIGLSGLYILVSATEPSKILIEDIQVDSIGQLVKVCGEISEKRISQDGHFFFQIKDQKAISVVFFHNSVIKQSFDITTLKNTDQVCVIGNIDLYKNELEIVGKSIELTML